MSITINDIIELVFRSGYLNIIDRVKYSMTSSYSATKYMTLSALLNGISHYPVEGKHRFKFWDWALRRKLGSTIHGEDPIGFYLSHIDDSNEANCLSSGQIGEIMRDVGRTFPEHPIFTRNGPGELMLANILKATVSLRPDLGYCQGMNFVVGALLLGRLATDPDLYQQLSMNSSISEDSFPSTQRYQLESDIFWATQHLLANSGEGVVGDCGVLQMESIWSPGFPKMKIRVYQFDRLFKWTLPELHCHCENILLSTEVMVSQWFMTLFSYMFPLEFTHHIWDYIFLSGWPGVFKVTLALLYALSDKLLEMDLEQVGLMIRDWKRGKFSLAVSVDQILQSAEKFIVTIETLNTLQEGYALEIIKAAFSNQKSELKSRSSSSPEKVAFPPSPSQIKEELEDVSTVYKELVELELQVEKDKEVIQRKILLACEACESTTTSLHKAIQEEANWIEKTTEIKYELEKWSTKVTSLVSVIHGIDEVEQKISAADLAARAPNPQDSGFVIGQIEASLGLTESADGHDDDGIDDGSLDDGMDDHDSGTSSTIEEEHARLAEEYEDEDFGYEDENESVDTSPSSLSETEQVMVLGEDENDVMNALGMLKVSHEDDKEEEDEVDGEMIIGDGRDNGDDNGQNANHSLPSNTIDINHQEGNSTTSPNSPPPTDRKPSFESITTHQNFPEQQHEENVEHVLKDQASQLNPPSSPSPGRGTSPEYLSVVEKMKSHPNRRRIVGIFQSTTGPYRNSIVAPKNPSILNPTTRVGPLDDPSIIADSLLRSRNQSQGSLITDDSEKKREEGQEEGVQGVEQKDEEGEANEEDEEVDADDSGYQVDQEQQQQQQEDADLGGFSIADRELSSSELQLGVGIKVDSSLEAESDPKNFSAFRFSSKIREGLDLLYRATSTSTPGGGSQGSSSSNSLLALADKERRRWMKRKNGAAEKSPNSNSDQTNRQRLQFPRGSLLSRERLRSNRKKNQMVEECRKFQLKVAKLTRALDVAKRRLRMAHSLKMEALLADEESKQWKESLCHQFQLLVEDSTRCRSQKLLYIAETYGG